MSDCMKIHLSHLFACIVILSLLTCGCTDILTKQKVGSFGDAGGAGTTPPSPRGNQRDLRVFRKQYSRYAGGKHLCHLLSQLHQRKEEECP